MMNLSENFTQIRAPSLLIAVSGLIRLGGRKKPSKAGLWENSLFEQK